VFRSIRFGCQNCVYDNGQIIGARPLRADHRMLARFSRRLIAILIAFSVIVVSSLWTLSPIVAGLSLIFIGLVFSLTLAIQFAAAVCINRHDDVPLASMRQVLYAWLQEISVAIKVFLWWQPFRSQKYQDTLIANSAGRSGRGVVFVHGFLCNRGIWNDWYPVLEHNAIPYEAIDLEPVIASIDSYTGLLDSAVSRLHDETGKPPLVVCHSMGGLVVRAWLRATNADARVHRIVTIGTPHQGTRVGNWAPHWPRLTNAQQMRSDARWLSTLADQETDARRSKFVCFYSNCDNIVTPATSAMLPGADSRHIAGVPHLALLQDERVLEQSLALL